MNDGVTLTYLHEYLKDSPHYGVSDCWACSVNAPVSVAPIDYPNWPALLDDLLPVGKSRVWWLNYLNMSRRSEFAQNYALLTHACMSPIGNMRIKEAVPALAGVNAQRFNISDVARLQHDFLEYANAQGAAVGGATGAGGVAPKLLLMVEDDQVYIDGDFAGKPLAAIPYLTKFARNTRSTRDNDILRAEGVFYQVLDELLADTPIETIAVSHMLTLEHESQVSLWLPRFDIQTKDGVASRIGMESIYSIINTGPGSYQNHFDVMRRVWKKIKSSTCMSSDDFAKQYLARDLLNLVFGNSDNHGRNISFLKFEGDIQFAPIYDFAPMKADPEMVTRLFKWGSDFESGGQVRFDLIVKALDDFCAPEDLLAFLNDLAQRLVGVPERLEHYGCPESIFEFPAIGFRDLPNKLRNFGVTYD
ncbi:HipA domain-containing protein [Idiomarina aquatica]|nr:HipA domain-containing protein [Idiomarina aquatica]